MNESPAGPQSLRAANAVTKEQKKQAKLDKELARLKSMWDAEHLLADATRFVFGIDEAGRGPLCGPVVAGCCILPPDAGILWLNDSKKLSESRREELYEEITRTAIAWGVGITSPERIDEINILQATFEAMRQAFANCTEYYHSKHIDRLKAQGEELSMDVLDDIPSASDTLILVDGNRMIPGLELRQRAVIGGDAKCPSISAASILAKVTRDRMMIAYDREYPEYGFAQHKGYGTKQHMDAIRSLGILPIHRRSFLKNL
ncbi:MAG: ribonuclease HII [Lachnospiraceae bacterium]|nr:ribonuclease HII [Lachnospiraceae bacterium]